MSGDRADMVSSDTPYNVPVAGHAPGRGQVRHAEIAFASGEMSEGEFLSFSRAIRRPWMADQVRDGRRRLDRC
jgi:hypothetical protein